MKKKQEIILRYFRDGDSKQKISRDLKVCTKTIRKYLEEYQLAQQQSNDPDLLPGILSKLPRYKMGTRPKRKLTLEITTEIDNLLHENQKRLQKGLRKQLMKKIDIHEYLLDKGFSIGYTSVCNYIYHHQRGQREAFIRQDCPPGSSVEFDWAEVKLEIWGVLKRFFMAIFTSTYSNKRWAFLFDRQDTLAFMEAHILFFALVEGVYHEVVYDNMRVAVARFVGKNDKKPTQALLQLSGYYHFHFRFCNAGKGNEKGHVERSVEYIRRKAFSRLYQFDDFDQAQAHLGSTCKKENTRKLPTEDYSKQDLFAIEKPYLWHYPGKMQCFDQQTYKVDKYATICFANNRYSSPDHLVGKMIDVKIYAQKLELNYQGNKVGEHPRSYDRYSWTLCLDHYLDTLLVKPGALNYSAALKQAPNWVKELYTTHFSNQAKAFIELLQYCKKHGYGENNVTKAVKYLVDVCPNSISSEKLMAVLGNKPVDSNVIVTEGEIETYSRQQLFELSNLLTQD
ncbi:MAG: IS21 family transposase [Candidatus Scalindua sp.]|jgi:hypothetical protein|nr:IS21 family transposase [Candidatus Scalindua sp.]